LEEIGEGEAIGVFSGERRIFPRKGEEKVRENVGV
jgi:hypothetical protein